jgi:hypothetical protein
MNLVNNNEEFCEVTHYLIDMHKKIENMYLKKINMLITFNFIQLNINFVKQINLLENVCRKKIEIVAPEIPCITIYNSLINANLNLSDNTYYSLYSTLTTINSNNQIKTIMDLITIDPFTIYFIDNPTDDMFLHSQKIFLEKHTINRILNIDYLKDAWKLYNFTKVIIVPVKKLFKLYDYKTRKSTHILTYDSMLSTAIKTFNNTNWLVSNEALYIIDNKDCIGKIEQLDYIDN